jgi:hypothetical protein
MTQPVDNRPQKYGRVFREGFDPLNIELYAFREGFTVESGGLGKAQHFKNVVNYLWGKHNKVKKFVWHPWAEELLEALCAERYVGAAGCASSGKTELAAIWGIVNFLCAPNATMVILVSTTLKSARQRIWGSVVQFWQAVPGLPGKLVDSQGLIRLDDGTGGNKFSDKCGLVLVPCERSQEKDAISKMIGLKNKRVFLIADELSELTDSIGEVAFPGGNLTSNPYFQFVGLSNPASYYDPFGRLIEPKAGWASINVDSERWETNFGVAVHFDALKSPNVLAGKTLFPFLPTQQKIDEALKANDPNSARFFRMMRGFFCPEASEDRIYSESDFIKFEADKPIVWASPGTKVAALDPAFTNGGDRSVLYFGTYGTNKDGLPAINFDGYEILNEDVTNKHEPRSYQIAKKFRKLCEDREVRPENAAFDATGAGITFGDVVRVVWSDKVHRISFGGGASERPASISDNTPSKERYTNRVSEIWFSAKQLLRGRQIGGISPDLAKELCARKFYERNSKLCVEPKEQMKSHFGKSPDLADAALMLVLLCQTRFGFGASGAAHRPAIMGATTSWRAATHKFASASRGRNNLQIAT